MKLALFIRVLRTVLTLDIGTKLAAWALLSSGPLVVVANEFALELLWNDAFIGAPQEAALNEAGPGLVALTAVLAGALALVVTPLVGAWTPLWRRVALLGGALFGAGILAEVIATSWVPELTPRMSMIVRGAGIQTWLAVVLLATRSRYLAFSLCVLWAGNAGNLCNAVFLPGIIDFVQLRPVGDFVFNLADVFITAGAALIALYLPLRALETIVPLGAWAPSHTFEYTPRPCEPGERAS